MKKNNRVFIMTISFTLFLIIFSFPSGSIFANVDCCVQEKVCCYDTYPYSSRSLRCCRNSEIWCIWDKSLWCQDFNMHSVSSCPALVAPCWQQDSSRVIYQNQYGEIVARTAWRYQRVDTTCDPAPPVGADPEFQWFRHTNSNCYTSLCNNDICPCKP